MNTKTTQQPALKLTGLTLETDFTTETNPETGKIGPLWDNFMQNALPKIPEGGMEAPMYGIYYNYKDGNYKGRYTVMLAQQLPENTPAPDDLQTLEVPTGKFLTFTTKPGPMPDVLINAWHHIWEYMDSHPEYTRTYQFDYELYDHRAADMANAIIEIHIGIE